MIGSPCRDDAADRMDVELVDDAVRGARMSTRLSWSSAATLLLD